MASQAQHKAGFLSLESAEVEVDYTSQIDKDLQKRRDFLFQLTLPNKVVYLLQAPGANQRVQWWVVTLSSHSEQHVPFLLTLFAPVCILSCPPFQGAALEESVSWLPWR